MLIRPVDALGDILPVRSAAEMMSGSAAVGRLAADRLRLLRGDWWESPDEGFQILELLREDRISEQNLERLSDMISAFLLETPEVAAVDEVRAELTGHVFSYACRLICEGGTAEVEYEMEV